MYYADAALSKLKAEALNALDINDEPNENLDDLVCCDEAPKFALGKLRCTKSRNVLCVGESVGMSDRYDNANSQAPGTVYDWVARNAIDLLLVDSDDSDYKSGKSYFFRQVTTHPAFAYEIFAVKGGSNATETGVTLRQAAVTEITVPFPDVPDFITSCYLQTELPAIVAKYDSSAQHGTGVSWYDYTRSSTEYYSSGNQFSTASSAANTVTVSGASSSGAQNFVALAPNDECDPTNSSLSYSGLSDYLGPDPLVQKASDLDAFDAAGTGVRGAITGLSASADASGAVTEGSYSSISATATITIATTTGSGYGVQLSASAGAASASGVAYGIMDGGFNYAVGDTITATLDSKTQVLTVGSVQPRGVAFGDLLIDTHSLRDASKRWALKDVVRISPADSTVVTSSGKNKHVDLVVTSISEDADGNRITGWRTRDEATSSAVARSNAGNINGGTGFKAGTTCVISGLGTLAGGVGTADSSAGGNGTNPITMAEIKASTTVTVKANPTFRRSFRCVPPMEIINSEYGLDFVRHADDAQGLAPAAGRTAQDSAANASGMQQRGVPLPKYSQPNAANNQGSYLANEINPSDGVEYNNKPFVDPSSMPSGPRSLVAGHFAHYVRGAGLRMVEKAKFKSDQGTYDTHDFMTLYAFEELIGHEGKRSQYLNNMYPSSREELIQKSLAKQDIVRLPFFFTLSYQCSLENVATLLSTYELMMTYARCSGSSCGRTRCQGLPGRRSCRRHQRVKP